MGTSTHETARTHYLQALLARYGTIVIPISSGEQQIALDSVFQPLALSQRSLLALKDERESQAQAGPQQGATNQPAPEEPVQARDGSEALEKSPSRRLLILGGPGMGKTTLLKALLQKAIAMALAEPTAPLPLFLSLPDLARSGETLMNYLPHILAELGIESTFATELRSAITNGRAFLCLDSLDEVLPAQRPDVIALINQHAPQYGGTWIVGSRFTEYQGGQFSGGRFVEWELLPLDEVLRRQLAEHLLPLLGELFQKSALSLEAFLRDLAHDRRIAEWGENPLLFSLAPSSMPGTKCCLPAGPRSTRPLSTPSSASVFLIPRRVLFCASSWPGSRSIFTRQRVAILASRIYKHCLPPTEIRTMPANATSALRRSWTRAYSMWSRTRRMVLNIRCFRNIWPQSRWPVNF